LVGKRPSNLLAESVIAFKVFLEFGMPLAQFEIGIVGSRFVFFCHEAERIGSNVNFCQFNDSIAG